jgi:hypothetical protein
VFCAPPELRLKLDGERSGPAAQLVHRDIVCRAAGTPQEEAAVADQGAVHRVESRVAD